MRLAHPEALSRDIEQGLSEVSFIAAKRAPELRMRDSFCGIVSVAIAEALRQQGYSVELVVSSPNLPFDPDMTHVLPIVEHGGKRTVVDGTYSQFLSYAGLVPGYVIYGGENKYPEDKFAVFPVGEHQETVGLLADIAHSFIRDRQVPEQLSWKKAWEFDAMDRDEIAAALARIWDPSNFQAFDRHPDTLEAGRKMARHILPPHAELIV